MCKIKCSFYEVFWKSSSPSAAPVHKRTLGNKGEIPGNDKDSIHIWLRTLYAKDIVRESKSPIIDGNYPKNRYKLGKKKNKQTNVRSQNAVIITSEATEIKKQKLKSSQGPQFNLESSNVQHI